MSELSARVTESLIPQQKTVGLGIIIGLSQAIFFRNGEIGRHAALMADFYLLTDLVGQRFDVVAGVRSVAIGDLRLRY